MTSPTKRLEFDLAAWRALRQAAPGVPLPASFEIVPPADRSADSPSDSPADGMADSPADGPSTDPAPDAAPDPALLAALLLHSTAPVTIAVRAWTGERAVLADLAVTEDRGTGLARAQRITPDGRPIADEPWVEFSAFLAGDVLAEVLRAMPTGLTEATAGPADHDGEPESTEIGWETSLAAARALREDRADLLAALRANTGEDGVAADLLADVATGLRGAVDVQITARRAGASDRWLGLWLLTGYGPVAITITTSAGSEPGETSETGETGETGETRVRLTRTTGDQVRADLIWALTGAFSDLADLSGAR